MTAATPVGRTAFLLGIAGLLPQVATVGWIAIARTGEGSMGRATSAAIMVGLAYPLIILSFLGGIWWGFAMRRDRDQGALAALAVAPSLAALALLLFVALTSQFGWGLVAIGCALLLTLLVDRALARRGDAPDGWMRLRAPLSVGLGGLTIILGALVGNPMAHL